MSAQIIPFQEREHAFVEPCEDVLACGAIRNALTEVVKAMRPTRRGSE